jgi:predicted anti-sigma-YlaC factor YlaD
MTCHDALTLLEDYVDRDLPADKEALVREHLAGCASCRQDVDKTVFLKELLRQHKPQNPGEDYWLETTRLILARTTESNSGNMPYASITDSRERRRHAFMRSVVSVAASLAVLFSALLLGSGQEQRLARLGAAQPPVFVSAPLEEIVGADNTIIVSRDENDRLARGMLLMGAPGTLGRFMSPFVIASATN